MKNGWDLSELEAFERGLERMGDQLADGGALFRVHELRYLDLARQVSEQTLLLLRPDGVDPDEWYDQVRDFSSLIFSRMSGASLEIFYEGRAETDATGRGVVPITYEDVLDWVQAGPENGGKDKTAIENTRNRPDEQIAYDVHQAILQHRLGFEKKDYSRITERLERWVESRVLAGGLGDMLVAALDAWLAVLAPVMERDLSDWMDDLMADV